MKNLNDPLMTNQERCHLLQLATDPELLKRHEQEAEKGNHTSFPSYWVLSVSELYELALASNRSGSLFQYDCEGIKQGYHPNASVVLFECERVEQGEWDNFYKGFSPHGYQGLFAVVFNAWSLRIDQEEERIYVEEFDPEEVKDFPLSYRLASSGMETFSIVGLLEVPLVNLSPFQEKRIFHRTWFMSRQYNKFLELVFDHMRKSTKKSFRSSKGFGS